MRVTLFATLIAAVLVGVAWLTWYRGPDVIVPAGEPLGAERNLAKPEPGPPRVGEARAERATDERAKSSEPVASGPTTPTPTPPEPKTLAEGEGLLLVQVLDRATRTPLPRFKTLLRLDGPRKESEQSDGQAQLAVPFDRPAELSVEAEGYVPHGPTNYEVRTQEQRRSITIELDRTAQLAGVVLTVTDARGMPVSDLALRVWSLAQDGTRLEPPLWQRINQATDGIYRVPDLKPGNHEFEIVAIDEHGDPLPWLMAKRPVRFLGGEQLPVQVQLGAGAMLRVTVRDATGQILGNEVRLRLRDESAPITAPLDVRWRAHDKAAVVVRRNGLPLAAQAHLEQAIAPGRYTLEVARANGTPITRDVALAPGESLALDITLPGN